MALKNKSILFVGHCYYNHWYLSREMRKLGWRADVLDVDADGPGRRFVHGQDFDFNSKFRVLDFLKQFFFFAQSIFRYKIFVFSGIHYMKFGHLLPRIIWPVFGKGAEIRLLKRLGKKIIYVNNGCRDGVLQSTFSKWQPYNVCSICGDRDKPGICSDEQNKVWCEYRNEMMDYQLLLGGNRADYNLGSHSLEAPWAYSLDKYFWNPNILVPSNYQLPFTSSTFKLYHSVGNFEKRQKVGEMVTIKGTHTYLKVIEELKSEGKDIEMIFFNDVPNKVLRYYMAQADVVADMLTYGFFGANVREALMMGKPVICYLRPEWMESMSKEIPEFVEEMPIISATPETVKATIEDLMINEEKRLEIGRKSRQFAEKWFASDVSSKKADKFFTSLLQ